MNANEKLKERIKELVVQALKLEVAPGELGDDEALFGSELGADSIGTLEIVFALEAEFGIEVEDDELRVELFDSVQTLAAYVEKKLAAKEDLVPR